VAFIVGAICLGVMDGGEGKSVLGVVTPFTLNITREKSRRSAVKIFLREQFHREDPEIPKVQGFAIASLANKASQRIPFSRRRSLWQR
jgi:hypothetical protein